MPKKPIAKKTYAPDRTRKIKATRVRVTSARTEDWWDQGKKKLSGVKLCSRCEAVWYDGHWHNAPRLAAALKAKKPSGKAAKDVLCEECRFAAHGPASAGAALFEGELTLDGLTDAKEKAEILATVRNAAKKAQRRDPEARIVAIDDRGSRAVVTVTENQLAAALGKAVDASHKGGKLRITWSEGNLPARVRWTRKAAR